VALTGNANLVALESGNSVGVILSNYLKCVPKATASRWYKINPRGSGKVVALPTKVKVA
jgi:hypothetical protein